MLNFCLFKKAAGITAFCCLMFSSVLSAGEFHYVFPANISLSLTPTGKTTSKNPPAVKGVIQAKIGTLRNMEIFFESSPDLEVSKKKDKVDSLEENQEKEFAISLSSGEGKPDEMGSWVKMRVKYLPDYSRIRKIIDNPASFPIDIERKRLLDIISRNSKTSSVHQDAIRFFLK